MSNVAVAAQLRVHLRHTTCAAGNVVDIQAVCKSTVARGEDDFPSGIVRITDCHDTVIYVLAPLQYASIACCTDCTVVVGAVARMLRLDRCERLQVSGAMPTATVLRLAIARHAGGSLCVS